MLIFTAEYQVQGKLVAAIFFLPWNCSAKLIEMETQGMKIETTTPLRNLILSIVELCTFKQIFKTGLKRLHNIFMQGFI